MCITKVARVLSVDGKKAMVKYVDDDSVIQIDVSMVTVRKNSYVEIFADTALNTLTGREAQSRKKLWLELKGYGRS